MMNQRKLCAKEFQLRRQLINVYELIHKLLSRRYEKGTSSATLSDDKSRSTVEHKYEVDLAKVRYRFEIFQ